MANDRLREEAGDIFLVTPEGRVSGPGSTPIMAAFTTGIALRTERMAFSMPGARSRRLLSKHATIVFAALRATSEPAQKIGMRVYAVDLDADLHDIQVMREGHAAYYHPSSYAVSQQLALKLWENGSNGIVYASVCDDGVNVPPCFVPGSYPIVGRNDGSAMYEMEGPFPQSTKRGTSDKASGHHRYGSG